MGEIFQILIVTAVSIPLGIFLGCSAVYVFNHLPPKWLCEYGEEPSEALQDRAVQRIKGYPNKFIFSALFTALGIFFGTRDYVYGLTVLFELWLLLMIALADQKYMVVPDQFVIFLALFAFPMSIYKETFQDMIYGFLLGIGVMLLAAFFGRLVMRREALGFGDVKLMGAIGLSAGLSGTAFILIAASLLSCAGFLYGILKGRLKKEDAVPLAPYLALATAVYFFFY